jgi:hypothetical protein
LATRTPAHSAARWLSASSQDVATRNSEDSDNLESETHMSDKQDKQRSEADAELERVIRDGRKFTLDEVIGRLAGPGALKGESPITRMQQAEFEIESFLRRNLADRPLEVVLLRYVKGSDVLLHNLEQPMIVLASCCQRILISDYLLKELVRDADVEWGRVMQERPYFEKEGTPHHPDDPYTVESVRRALSDLVKRLTSVISIVVPEG